MLTEILTGIEFYLFILGAFSVLYWVIPYKYRIIPYVITVALFCYFAHMLVPDRSDDLQLYFWFIDRIRAGGNDTFSWIVANDNFGWKTFFVSKYFYRFISLLPDSRYNHFLSSITILITYGTAFRTLYCVSKRFEIDKIHNYLGVMFFLATFWFFDSASGIRSSIAICIVFACAYQQFMEKKHYTLCFIGYFIAAFFHPGGVIALLVVVITMLTLNTDGKFFNFLLLFSFLIGTSVMNYLGEISDSGIIQAIFERTEKYAQRAGDDSSTSFFVMVFTLVFISLLFLYVSGYVKSDSRFSEYSKFYKYCTNTFFFLFGIFFISVVFSRFVRWIIPQIGAITFMVGMQFQKNTIVETGIADALYNSSPIERLKYKARPVVLFLFVAFIVVYIWYACNGTSLIWAHFEHEWREMGLPYIWESWYDAGEIVI